jgi:GTP pyrophosphokinase
MRVITRSLQDCYAVLGIIHNLWRPVPGRIKDFIAMPRPNFYQSLHTSVITEDGTPFEIQIRTEDMHRRAEYGIAAHWRYKEHAKHDGKSLAMEEKLDWLKQALEWQQELKDPREFLTALKVECTFDQIFIFTPKGKVIKLPQGATPLDFAYAVHTEIGHHCYGAKVNNRIVPLTCKLISGEMCEILTRKNARPHEHWLDFVITATARARIRKYLREHDN